MPGFDTVADIPTPLAKAKEKKAHIKVPIEEFAIEHEVPNELAKCLIGKTEKETFNNINILKEFLKSNNKTPGKRPDEKFTSALNTEEIIEIIKAYFICDCNSVRAEESLPYTRKTIVKYWKMFGFNLAMGAPSKSKEVVIKEGDKDTFTGKENARLTRELSGAQEKIGQLEKQNAEVEKELEHCEGEIAELTELSKEKSTKESQKEKPDTFLSMIKVTTKWIDKNIGEFKSKVEDLKREIEKKEAEIKEYEVFIDDCLECSKSFLEFAADICKNREKAEFYKDYGASYKLNKNQDKA